MTPGGLDVTCAYRFSYVSAKPATGTASLKFWKQGYQAIMPQLCITTIKHKFSPPTKLQKFKVLWVFEHPLTLNTPSPSTTTYLFMANNALPWQQSLTKTQKLQLLSIPVAREWCYDHGWVLAHKCLQVRMFINICSLVYCVPEDLANSDMLEPTVKPKSLYNWKSTR